MYPEMRLLETNKKGKPCFYVHGIIICYTAYSDVCLS